MFKSINGKLVELSASEKSEVLARWADVDAGANDRTIISIQNAVQMHLDAAAQLKGYDSIHTAVTYADESSNSTFQAEGQVLRAWRSLVWASCYGLLEDWNLGNIQEPTIDEVITQLPDIVW